jgi:hypothetical protein
LVLVVLAALQIVQDHQHGMQLALVGVEEVQLLSIFQLHLFPAQ